MATASELFLVRFRYWLVSRRHDHPQRLRQHDQAQRLPGSQPERHRRLALAPADRQDAGAHDLGDEARGIDRQAEQQRGEFRRDAACRRAKLKPCSSGSRAPTAHRPRARISSGRPTSSAERRPDGGNCCAGRVLPLPRPARQQPMATATATSDGARPSRPDRRPPWRRGNIDAAIAEEHAGQQVPAPARGAGSALQRSAAYQKNSCSSSGMLRKIST